MRLFDALSQEDKQNVISFCINNTITSLLQDNVQLETIIKEECQENIVILERAIKEAKQLPEEQWHTFLMAHEESGQIILDIAVNSARNSYYASLDETVIYYEELRSSQINENIDVENNEAQDDNELEELIISTKKPNHFLN